MPQLFLYPPKYCTAISGNHLPIHMNTNEMWNSHSHLLHQAINGKTRRQRNRVEQPRRDYRFASGSFSLRRLSVYAFSSWFFTMPKLLSARGHGRLESMTRLESEKIENNTKNATVESSLCCNSLLAASNSRHSLIIRLHLSALLNFIVHSHSPCQRVKKSPLWQETQ